MGIKITSPVNGEIITKDLEKMEDDEVRRIIEYADMVSKKWRTDQLDFREGIMRKAANVLSTNRENYARLITQEMGKPILEAKAEIDKCVWVCEYYAEHSRLFLQPDIIKTSARKSMVVYQPLGLILAVMPWNFPFWQVFRFAAPALMAGNGAVLKHASNVPGCAMAIQHILEEAGVPKGLFSTLLIDSKQVEAVIRHPKIKAVTLTGSELAGSAVASLAGKHIKKTVLELGGSDPYLILKDADIEHAAEVCKNSRLINSGQSCIGAKRIIVVREVYDAFLEVFTKKMQSVKLGDPFETDTEIGPMARFDLRDELHEQVLKSIKSGAKCILGGAIPALQGAYYPATILVNVGPGMPAYEEELFGPVAAIIRAKDEADAIRIANDSEFGLGAAIFTQDLERGEYIAREKIEAGACFVNELVKSDPRLPFGGVKKSGYGRELSRLGIKEFVNAKTVYINA